jgi:hypothetical protein
MAIDRGTGLMFRDLSPPPTPGPRPPLKEAEWLSIACADPSPLGRTSGPPRACTVWGRITGIERRPARILAREEQNIAALVLTIEPVEMPSCTTALDRSPKKGAPEPESSFADLVAARTLEIIGGERLAGELVVGRRLCGFARINHEPGLRSSPGGWEGRLDDEHGARIALASEYAETGSIRRIFGDISLTREGAARREPIDEGGAFLYHPSVRVTLGRASVRVGAGEEQTLTSPGGDRFAVRAWSRLTTGPTPVFTGRWDGYSFSILRLPAP